jgi:sugar phosphate isomerase/epimerase
MELGFITNALAGETLTDIASWGAQHGYDFMEIGPHAPLAELEGYLTNERPLAVTALLYCRNVLHADPDKRREFTSGTQKRLELARDLGVGIVNISTGIDPSKPLRDNIPACADILRDYCDLAGENVTVADENCPDTGNIAVNPEIWLELIARVERPNFKLTYDPSHLIRLLIEPYESLYDLAGHIVHVHAKDAEVNHTRLAKRGFLDDGWWRYRVPGWGQVDWQQVLTRLHEIGFTGGISLEHEDPLFGGHHDGRVDSLAEAKAGLQAGAAHLRPLLKTVLER